LLAPGVKIALAKGHRLDAYYIYRRVMDTEVIKQELFKGEGVTVDIDESMTHELVAAYTWTPSPWFDVRITGQAVIPGEGAKDIASVQDCDPGAGFRSCDGEDISLLGEIRVRARF